MQWFKDCRSKKIFRKIKIWKIKFINNIYHPSKKFIKNIRQKCFQNFLSKWFIKKIIRKNRQKNSPIEFVKKKFGKKGLSKKIGPINLSNTIETSKNFKEFEPHKAQYSTPNLFDWLFIIRAYWNPESRQGPGLGGFASHGGPEGWNSNMPLD